MGPAVKPRLELAALALAAGLCGADAQTPDRPRDVDWANAETVAVTFMGLRLGCAKCHQHPFEKWGQEDYYGMAAFFARICSASCIEEKSNSITMRRRS